MPDAASEKTPGSKSPASPARAGKYARPARPASETKTERAGLLAANPAEIHSGVVNPGYETLAGVIVSAHGIQGTLKVRPATGTALRLFAPSGGAELMVWIGPSNLEGKLYRVLSAKRQEPKDIYLVRVENVNDRTAAEMLQGQSLFAPDARRAPLEQDEFFASDLIGLEVVDEKGVALGRLTDVLRSPAHDVYETDHGVLIPAVKEYVARIDLAAKKLIVHDSERLQVVEASDAEAAPTRAHAD